MKSYHRESIREDVLKYAVKDDRATFQNTFYLLYIEIHIELISDVSHP